jgi:anti-anti-sigma regulatory factor
MLRIHKSSNGRVIFALSGEIDEEEIPELEALLRSEANGRTIVLDLKNLTLVGRDAISFLGRCEAHGISLQNCAGYVRKWLDRKPL